MNFEEFVRSQDVILMRQKLPVTSRPIEIAKAWIDKNSLSEGLTIELIRDVFAVYKDLYPSQDISRIKMFEGGVAILGNVYNVDVDLSYGRNHINPLSCIDISEEEKNRLWSIDKREIWKAIYSVSDLYDFSYGVDDILSKDMMDSNALVYSRSCLAQLWKTLFMHSDFDASIESLCLATELAIKSMLINEGYSSRDITRIGHKIGKLCESMSLARPGKNDELVKLAGADFPNMVSARYDGHNLSRDNILDLAMRANFLCGEAVRRISERGFSKAIEADTQSPSRKDVFIF